MSHADHEGNIVSTMVVEEGRATRDSATDVTLTASADASLENRPSGMRLWQKPGAGAESERAEDALANTLIAWAWTGGFAGCAAGALYDGFGGAFVGATALSALATVAAAVVLAVRARWA